jgi:acyl carrier protein
MSADDGPTVAEILEREELGGGVAEATRLEEVDSLLVAELVVALSDEVGRPVAVEAFPPDVTTLADLVRFAANR